MNKPNPIWMRLRSGMILNLIDPSPHCWTDEDLAVRLARTYRWSSDTRWERPLPVAQHSLTVLRLRECAANRPLTAAEQIRELLHDAEEGLFHFDSPSPMKRHLGAGYRLVASRLRGAIDHRYDVPRWDRASYEAHKRADRTAAASEALHVVGWSALGIRDWLEISVSALDHDPLPPQPGLQPWEPWPSHMAAKLFLERLAALQREMVGAGEGDEIVVVPLKDQPERVTDRPDLKPTFVLVEGRCETIEGQIVKGVRDEAGEWDLDGAFTVQTEDGSLFKVNGWTCRTEVQ